MEQHNYESFSVIRKSGFAILTLHEKRIYMQLAEKFRQDITQFLQNEDKHIIINLAHVSVMNSAALGVLIALQNELEKRNGKLYVTGLQPLMKEIFLRMRLELLFEIEDSAEKVLAKHSST